MVRRDCIMGPLAEDIPHKTRDSATWSHLHKSPDALLIEPLHLPDELHRRLQLPGQKRHHFIHTLGIGLGVDVGQNGTRGHPNVEPTEDTRQRLRRGRHDLAVKSMRHRNMPRVDLELPKPFNGAIHCIARSGDHRLGAAVLVGRDHIPLDGLQDLLHPLRVCCDGGHFSVVLHLDPGHLPTAGAHRVEGIREGQHPRRHAGRILSKRVPHDKIGAHTKRLQEPHHGHIRGQHRRLANLGLLQSLRRLGRVWSQIRGPHDFRQGALDQRPEDIIRLPKSLLHHRISPGKILKHVDVLGALARKEEGHLGVGRGRLIEINPLSGERPLPASLRIDSFGLCLLKICGCESQSYGRFDGHVPRSHQLT